MIDKLSGQTFDDYTENFEGTHSHWTQLCENHAVHYSPTLQEMPNDGMICGVKGCKKEALYYYDFNPIPCSKS